jgi:plastocyanin
MRPGCALLLVCVAIGGCGSPAATPPPAAISSSPAGSQVTGTAPRNAIVTLLPAAASPPMPAEPAVMDQISKQFLPGVLIARVGQPVEFRNSEDMPHNVAVTRRGSGAEVFTVSTEPHQKYVHTFDRVGQFDVKCDIHEGMEALVIVSKGPMTTIAEDDGRFSFADVALGSYTVSVTFEGQTVEQPLEVATARTSFRFSR